jgi:hypothetical protein
MKKKINILPSAQYLRTGVTYPRRQKKIETPLDPEFDLLGHHCK